MDRFIKFLFWGLFLLSPWAIQAQNATTIYPAITQEYTELQFDSALKSMAKAHDTFEKADLYRRYADYQQKSGQLEIGHEYYWKAIAIYDKLHKYPTQQSYCYYQLATGYYQLSDIKAIANIVKEMMQLAESHSDKRIRYDYYSVCSVYYEMLRQQQPEHKPWRDSIEYYNLQSINIIESMTIDDMLAALIKPVWNFYNHALFYDYEDGLPAIDSIEKYLNKAEEYVQLCHYKGWERDECYISIYDERAWLYYYKKDYKKAEKEMFQVINLLDTVDQYSPNTVLIEREQAYSFLAMLYEETGKPAEALKYQKMMNEVMKERYDLETQNSIHRLMVQYEVEKQNSEISHLQAENKATRKAMWLTIGLCLICLSVIILLLWIFQLHRTNMKDLLYEKELEKENIQQELQYQKQLHQLDESRAATLRKQLAENLQLANTFDEPTKANYLARIENLNYEEIEKLAAQASQKLTSLDIKYIICFMIGMSTEDIAMLFSISNDSVYSVRHRIRKKFNKNTALPF